MCCVIDEPTTTNPRATDRSFSELGASRPLTGVVQAFLRQR
jgi:hypothetical protein